MRRLVCRLAGASSDLTQAQAQIAEAHPDIIVIEDNPHGFEPEAMEIIRNCSIGIRVIGLNLTDNVLKLYRYEQRVAEQADDLLQFVLAA